jgi:hypothetical protein
MNRSLKIGLAVVGAIVALLVAGSVVFQIFDDRRAEAFKFALFEPENVLRDISSRAAASRSLTGSGKGLVVPDKASGRLGPTRWTVSPDGVVEGHAPERGLTVVWTPEMKDGKVEWRCKVEPPMSITPTACRDAKHFDR